MPRTLPHDPSETAGLTQRAPGAITAIALTAIILTCAVARPGAAAAQAAEDAVVQVVDAYHRSLAEGDSTTALSLLADEVVILESGGMETKEQYRSGHLSGDMRFAQAVPRERGEIQVRVVGGVAWAWSTNVAQGQMGDREVNSQGAELMVLRRIGGAWRIVAVHWSSRQRR
jgi:ketosteroid isomerase-like protein